MDKTRTITTWNRMAYAIGDFYGGGGFFLVSTFAMFFLINVAGLTGIEVGLLFGLSKIWDAFTDPFMGWLSDRTVSKFGRRRLYFIIGLIPIFISVFLIWYPVTFESHTVKFFYYLGAYLLFYTVSTMVQIPYSALAADMTDDPKERNALVGMRLVFSMISTLIIGILAQPFIDSFHDPVLGHKMLGIVGGLFCSLPFLLVLIGTWEIPHAETKGENVNFARNFLSIFNNKTFLIQLGMYIAAYTAMDVLMSWIKFYVLDFLRMPGFLSIGLGLLIITEIVSVGFYKKILDNHGAGRAYVIGLTIMAIGMLLVLVHAPAIGYKIVSLKSVYVGLNFALIGFGLGAGVYIPYALLPYSIDADELITGDKRSGTYAGGMTLFRKLIQGAIVMPLLGLLLDSIGYVAKAPEQSTATLSLLRILFVGIPVVLILIGLIASRAFRMTPKNHKIMVAELVRLREGGSKDDVSDDTRQICEKLTGRQYAELYSLGRD